MSGRWGSSSVRQAELRVHDNEHPAEFDNGFTSLNSFYHPSATVEFDTVNPYAYNYAALPDHLRGPSRPAHVNPHGFYDNLCPTPCPSFPMPNSYHSDHGHSTCVPRTPTNPSIFDSSSYQQTPPQINSFPSLSPLSYSSSTFSSSPPHTPSSLGTTGSLSPPGPVHSPSALCSSPSFGSSPTHQFVPYTGPGPRGSSRKGRPKQTPRPTMPYPQRSLAPACAPLKRSSKENLQGKDSSHKSRRRAGSGGASCASAPVVPGGSSSSSYSKPRPPPPSLPAAPTRSQASQSASTTNTTGDDVASYDSLVKLDTRIGRLEKLLDVYVGRRGEEALRRSKVEHLESQCVYDPNQSSGGGPVRRRRSRGSRGDGRPSAKTRLAK